MDTRKFDIVVFGATGMTGQYVFEELAKVSKRENVKFALAARNENKLKSVIKESQKYLQSLGETIDNVPTIIADINSENSILNMCKRTKVLLNCVGSFYLLGEAVIKTCIVTKTHYLDVAEESMFLEQMQLKYHEEAKRKGIYILGACGFGSIICDLGISLIKRKFQGDVNSVETYREFTYGRQRRNITFGTLKALSNSFIYGFKNRNKIKNIREQLNMEIFKKVPTFSYPLRKRPFLSKSESIGKWCLPFPGCDETVSLRSQLYNYNYKNQRPVQIKAYYIMSIVNFFSSLLRLLLIVMFRNLTKYFLNYMEESEFTFVYWAEGWKDKLGVDEQHVNSPNRCMRVTLNGGDAFRVTSLCLVNAGIACLKESEKMPESGGVLTPGSAFEDTSLLERLQKSGLQFVITENDLL